MTVFVAWVFFRGLMFVVWFRFLILGSVPYPRSPQPLFMPPPPRLLNAHLYVSEIRSRSLRSWPVEHLDRIKAYQCHPSRCLVHNAASSSENMTITDQRARALAVLVGVDKLHQPRMLERARGIAEVPVTAALNIKEPSRFSIAKERRCCRILARPGMAGMGRKWPG